jgi:glycerol-3-phosphate acyltransferase PlsY
VTTRWLLLLVGAYLVGSLPFSWAVVRVVSGKDVRRVGSGNVGATNAMRAAGKGAGALALLLDIAKGVAPVLAARWLAAPAAVVCCVAALAVLGHMYSPFLGFAGGKGVATAAGAMGALAPLAAALSVGVFVVVVAVTRYVSLGSLAAVTAFPCFVFLLLAAGEGVSGSDWPFLVGSTLVPAMIVWKHRGNIGRLRAGVERRLGRPPAGDTNGDTP